MKTLRHLTRVHFLGLLVLLAGCTGPNNDTGIAGPKADSSQAVTSLFDEEWTAPDTATIPANDSGALIRYGRDLVARTGIYFGPHGTINRSANGMNCQNCHLDAGTRLFANSFSAVYSNYPKFRARSGTVEHLEKRINDCMERSMNGKKLDSLSKEMRAMKAYIYWVGKDVPKGTTPKGASVADVPFLERSADIDKGRIAFKKNCVTCHGEDGQGKLYADQATFEYPPLWGPHSYNTAAGLYRITRLAGFIKGNMPNLTTTIDKPVLTNEEAWDIAAYISSMPRPEKKFDHDWPDISKKPIDHPFGPFADQFSEYRHKYGPFKELAASAKK